jgi:hypothetical protein
MYQMQIAFLCASLALMSGCAQFPALDKTADPAALAAPFPSLAPFESFPAVPQTPPPDAAAALAAQAGALQARADALRAVEP